MKNIYKNLSDKELITLCQKKDGSALQEFTFRFQDTIETTALAVASKIHYDKYLNGEEFKNDALAEAYIAVAKLIKNYTGTTGNSIEKLIYNNIQNHFLNLQRDNNSLYEFETPISYL